MTVTRLLLAFLHDWAAHVAQKETQDVEGTGQSHTIKAVAALKGRWRKRDHQMNKRKMTSDGRSARPARVHLLVYHLIFCPKYRRAPLEGHVKKRLEHIIHEIIYKHEWQLIELAIQPDHVDLGVRTNPSTLPSDLPRLIKGRSSRLLRQEFAHLRRLPVLWSPSYFLSSAGNVSSETVERYIQQQSEH